ncbi:MAG: MBOAT family protein [Oscillospiraceae bacterium]|nr:MBOAT family protein [Oscillospiraceae bacterium]
MVFSSNVFLFFFLPGALLLYYLCPRKGRNLLLLLISLLFYAWGEPVYVLLMVFTILLNFAGGIGLEREKRQGRSGRGILVLTLVLNLALLACFKYTGFLLRTLNLMLPAESRLRVPEILLPIGISFYIFQSMSYVIDVFRGTVSCQKNLITFGAYVSMFPQLIAGPIVRYRDVARQLEQRREGLAQFSAGVSLFVIGLAKKMLLANPMGLLREELCPNPGCLAAWVSMFAYTLQIYFDFSGYSDMAIGLGKMFGFEFPLNFDYPYISGSITEFWRRWHISLGSWFREYVYIPLGGKRRGLPRQLLNILIVWSLTGLWHGASWNFVFWGLYYAFLLALEKLFLLRRTERAPLGLRRLAVFLLVSFGWVLFAYTDAGELGLFLSHLFGGLPTDVHGRNRILAYLPLMLLALAAATPYPRKLFQRLPEGALPKTLQVLWLAVLMLLCVSALAGQSYNPFIYFRF